MKSTVYYQYGNPLKAVLKKHRCVYCDSYVISRKHQKIVHYKSDEARYYDFSVGARTKIIGEVNFVHKVFHCPNCLREIEYVAQFSFEKAKKWIDKCYNQLERYFSPDDIRKVFIDSNNNVSEKLYDINNLHEIAFLLSVKDKKYKVPCCVAKKTEFWERPVELYKDRRFKKALAYVIKLI